MSAAPAASMRRGARATASRPTPTTRSAKPRLSSGDTASQPQPKRATPRCTAPSTVAPGAWSRRAQVSQTSPSTTVPRPSSAVPRTTTRWPTRAPIRRAVPPTTTTAAARPRTSASPLTTNTRSADSPASTVTSPCTRTSRPETPPLWAHAVPGTATRTAVNAAAARPRRTRLLPIQRSQPPIEADRQATGPARRAGGDARQTGAVPGRAARYQNARHDPALVVLEGFHALKHALRFGAEVLEAVTADPAAILALAEALAPDLVPGARRPPRAR